MTVRFQDRDEWHAAIAAAVKAGLMFEAHSAEMNAQQGGSGFYTIDYTGGY